MLSFLRTYVYDNDMYDAIGSIIRVAHICGITESVWYHV